MIKVGQFLSARLDVLPVEITEELAGLQDEVPPEKFEEIRKQAEADLGAPLNEKYEIIRGNPAGGCFARTGTSGPLVRGGSQGEFL